MGLFKGTQSAVMSTVGYIIYIKITSWQIYIQLTILATSSNTQIHTQNVSIRAKD